METLQQNLLLDNDLLNRGRMTLRAINHSLRQKMVSLIHENGRMIVTDIYVRLRIEQSIASQHLAILRKEGFLTTEREGKCIFYSVNYERLKQVQEISEQLIHFN